MEHEQLTEQEVQRHISASFDSVGAIQRTISGEDSGMNNPVSWIEANVGHLNIMLEKEWFADALTEEQRADIDAIILAGNQYIQDNQADSTE